MRAKVSADRKKSIRIVHGLMRRWKRLTRVTRVKPVKSNRVIHNFILMPRSNFGSSFVLAFSVCIVFTQNFLLHLNQLTFPVQGPLYRSGQIMIGHPVS